MSEKHRGDPIHRTEDTALSVPDMDTAGLTELLHSGSGIESPFMRDIFLLRQAIVGTRFLGGSDELVEDLVPGSRVTLIREPDNRFDPNAVMALDGQGRKLGYIPRHENGIIGALLDAGKFLYGIIPENQPEQMAAPGSQRTPFSIWMDLYMREFALPDDISRIPRQGYQGSYAVADFILWTGNSRRRLPISSIYAIKVINGQERYRFCVMLSGKSRKEYREAFAAFEEFVGYLPIVSHDVMEEVLPMLEEAYGVQLGMPFSNRVIDTMQMAANHLPWIRDTSLENLVEELGIKVHGDSEEEQRCRMIWMLYCRMERSEVEKTP